MAKILRQITVACDGMHNGFTDLQYWQGCYWISFRKGAGHRSMDGRVIISMSSDRVRFREVSHLHVSGDNRDPKLIPISENKMALYFPSWTKGVETRELQQYITFTDNGFDWEKPVPILEPKLWLWRVRKHNERYYGLIQNLQGKWTSKRLPHELDLAISDDLINWKIITRIGRGYGLNESDIFWQSNGDAWIVARSVTNPSFFCFSEPPYIDWQVKEMSTTIHAPVFLEHNNKLYVAGRRIPETEDDKTFSFSLPSMGIWTVEKGDILPALNFPAYGDCSYPGIIKDPEGRICISYYSQHRYLMGIDNSLSFENLQQGNANQMVDDVYFAELEL